MHGWRGRFPSKLASLETCAIATRPATRCRARHYIVFILMIIIRPAIDQDLPAITEIYAHHVLTGTATFETTPPTEAEMAQRRDDVLAKGLPYLVADEGGH